MLSRANPRPFLIASLTALLTVGASLPLASAQQLQWQRGAAADASGPSTSSTTRSTARTTGSRVTNVKTNKRQAPTQPVRKARVKRTKPAEVQQVAFHQPVEQKLVSRAKRPATRESAANRVARSTKQTAAQRAAQSTRTAARRTSSAVQQAVSGGDVVYTTGVRKAVARGSRETNKLAQQAQYACECGECCPGPSCGCGCEPGCGVIEPGCGFVEPGCGCPEPGCGCPIMTPTCPLLPGCGPCGPVGCGDCACGDVGCCGECCGPPTCGCGVTGCLGGCAERGAVPLILYVPPIKEIVLFGGVHAFKNPLDYDQRGARDAGNFGFHEGINAGGKMSWLPWPNLGYQIGYQAAHSQLSGDMSTGSADSHTQQFFTSGLFVRRPVGLQYGLVYDMLRDERQGSVDFHQVRGLVSATNPYGGEIGFMFTAATSEEVITGGGAAPRTYAATDQYLGFYRFHGPQGGEFRVFGGGDGRNHGIFGGDIFAPLNHRWSIQAGFNYLIPTDAGDGNVGGAGDQASEEGWNIGMNLVWHWGAQGKRWYRSPWRPMFGVANNGSLMVDDLD